MGNSGSSSSTKTSVISRNVANALAQNIMNCKGSQLIKQEFIISGNYNVVKNTKQVVFLQLSSSCSQDVNNMADIQQSVSNAIKQTAEAQSASLLSVLGGSSSKVDTAIQSDIEANITQETIQNIVNSTNAAQTIKISGDNNIVDTFSQEMT